jgi:peroxiredoxin family protein
MHMMGMGTAMMKSVMKSKNIDDLPSIISQARLMGVKLLACEMAMNMMGIQKSELLDNVELAGVGNFAALAEKSGPVMFI